MIIKLSEEKTELTPEAESPASSIEKKYVLVKQNKVQKSGASTKYNLPYRIKALKSFGDVTAGDYGGYVASEDNLSQEGDCWIYGECAVYENAKVSGNAAIKPFGAVMSRVFGNAIITHNSVIEGAYVYEDAAVGGEAIVGLLSHVFGKARVTGGKIYGAKISGESRVFNTEDFVPVIRDATVSGHVSVFGGSISGLSKIRGDARVGENAQIKDQTSIEGKAYIKGSAIIQGSSLVSGTAEVSDNSILDSARVIGSAKISNFSKITGALIKDSAVISMEDGGVIEGLNITVSGSAKVKGTPIIKSVKGSIRIGEDAIVADNAQISDYSEITRKGHVFGHATVSGSNSKPGVVTGDAQVFGDAVVRGKVVSSGNIF